MIWNKFYEFHTNISISRDATEEMWYRFILKLIKIDIQNKSNDFLIWLRWELFFRTIKIKQKMSDKEDFRGWILSFQLQIVDDFDDFDRNSAVFCKRNLNIIFCVLFKYESLVPLIIQIIVKWDFWLSSNCTER
jgi:hypothetical protein